MLKKNFGLLLVFSFLAGSCSKVAFETRTNNNNDANNPAPADPNTNTVPLIPTPIGNISCSTYFNTNLSSVNVSSSAENPTVTAVCNPANVNLSWTVRNSANSAVTVNGLQGAQSVGDFYALGAGTYQVVLKATAANYNDFTSNAIAATVTVPGPQPLTRIACDVKLNNQYGTVDVRSLGTNPRLTANCNPSAGSYVWTVVSNGVNVTIPNLNGSDSVPDFLSLAPGLYDIYLQVNQNGYLPYQSTTPLTAKVTASPVKAMTFEKVVPASNNQLDLLLIIDDSNSMAINHQKLAAKMKTLTDKLTAAGFDWQMCATLTRPMKISSTNPNLYWGASVFWTGNTNSPAYILKSSTANVDTIYNNTLASIGTGTIGSEDERPIKSAWWHLYNGDYNYATASGCYRKDAGLAVVAIANEDERSYGGDLTQKYPNEDFTPLENDDLPQTLLTQVDLVFGANKRFVFNSIVVRPGDTVCKAQQDAIGPKSHYGVKLAEIAGLTNGYVGSICDSDYTNSLNYFKDQIVTSMKSFQLECTPVGNISVTVSPNFNYTYTLNGKKVIFDPAVPVGKNVKIDYNCIP